MADRLVKWYRTSFSREDFLDLVEFFARYGVNLEHPVLGTGVVLGPDGESLRVDASAIAGMASQDLKAMGSRSWINVQFWISSDVNVTCTFEYGGDDFWVEDFDLEGLSLDEQNLIRSLVWRYMMEHQNSTIGFIEDIGGYSSDFDWDEFFRRISRGELEVPDVYPDSVVVDSSTAEFFGRAGIPFYVAVDKFGDHMTVFRRLSALRG